MKDIPDNLRDAFSARMGETKLDQGTRRDYLKWLQFYIDFCAKYRHPFRDRDSLEPFLQKLASKRQSIERQQEAAASVSLYYEVVENRALKADRDPESTSAQWEVCLQKLKNEIRLRQYSPKTLQTYRTWITQFQRFTGSKVPSTIGADDARRFLTHLAVDRKVAASTQNQAFNALLFLFRHILKTDYDLGDTVTRARKTKYIPVVLSRKEIDAILSHLSGAKALAVQLLYGCGLRLFECLNLRVHCLNFEEGILTVHDGKGRKDRTLPIPRLLSAALERQVARVGDLHELDRRSDYDGVFMPFALDRKWKNASKELIWQWVFPARHLTLIPQENERRRYHMHETSLQTALRNAVRKSRVPKRVTCHTFRHSFASHLLQANYDIRTIQEMLGHSDVRTTMIYTHTVKSRTLKERCSPLDFQSV